MEILFFFSALQDSHLYIYVWSLLPQAPIYRYCVSTCPVGIILRCGKDGKTSTKKLKPFTGRKWKACFMGRRNNMKEVGVWGKSDQTAS